MMSKRFRLTKYRGQVLKVSKEELELYMKMYDRFLELLHQGAFCERDYPDYIRSIVNTHYLVMDQSAKVDEKLFDKEVEKVLGEKDA